MAAGGMVTSSNYLATQAGWKVLQQGGNAVDAAIAVASTISVVYPQMNTIGGDNFWLIYNAKTKELRALNASGRSGERATLQFYRDKGLSTIPPRGYLSVNTVPGVVSGWDEAYRYAQATMGRSLPWRDLLRDAVHYAEDGFIVTSSLAKWEAINVDTADKVYRNLQQFDGFRQIFLKPDGTPYRVGERLRQPELAQTLTQIAEKGAQEFYKGEIARKIVEDLQANGGLLTRADFANHRADWVKPITVKYRGYDAYNFPPNTQGFASLEILNILNQFDIRSLGEGSADYYHLLVEATKQAFADRDRYLSDPDFVEIPLTQLLSAKHGKAQAGRINMRLANHQVAPMDPKGDTVWFGVVDSEGNAVSLIQSIYYDFGSGIVPKGTGILLQNRGAFFSLDPNNVNHLAPHKRTFHTLNPAMLLKDGKPYLVYGTMGGEGQPQTQAAIVTRIVDFGMSPQEAINGPRWLYGRTWGVSSNDLKVEGRVPPAVTDELKRRGHPVKVVETYTDTMGHAGAILIDPVTGVRYGASDPRGDGLAAGD
ncbi:gamma-glutamyltransferase [Pandoraea apista]|uniref:Glutathione hydrolase proenzyme n=2 Tax=Pandoraea apista TaxID=93218 RepID=A0ABX9ZPB5_9BURK|nr:gamma-glutamyltransferase [Pandoraea apista]PTD99931.1 gamma-glutamyltransferase [Pandoraea apista]RRJ34856.1 gamma-glutamyltransferase [Pandoraea apista]RRJ80976.1 gamma-glutamyltransferase [Pandoraea apista]RSD16978.1 gamma-glutamyltransferase [Pandoraea apista]RSD21040.1 gamma-glutamyltransferase [Pandoraea apista]